MRNINVFGDILRKYYINNKYLNTKDGVIILINKPYFFILHSKANRNYSNRNRIQNDFL